MSRRLGILVAAAAVLAASAQAASARGNSNSGSGLSPYAAESGNDRSAGVNNGNYRPPRYNYYRRAYGPNGPYGPPRSYYGYQY